MRIVLKCGSSTSSLIAAKRRSFCSRTILAWGVSRRRKSCVWSFMMSRFYGLPCITKKREGLIHFIFDPWPASFDHRRSVVSRLVGTIGTVRDAHFFPLWLLPKRIFHKDCRSLVMGGQMKKKDFPLFWLVRPHYLSTVAFGRSVGNIPLDILEMQNKYKIILVIVKYHDDTNGVWWLIFNFL
jgi:hypothetical protein